MQAILGLHPTGTLRVSKIAPGDFVRPWPTFTNSGLRLISLSSAFIAEPSVRSIFHEGSKRVLHIYKAFARGVSDHLAIIGAVVYG